MESQLDDKREAKSNRDQERKQKARAHRDSLNKGQITDEEIAEDLQPKK